MISRDYKLFLREIYDAIGEIGDVRKVKVAAIEHLVVGSRN